MNERKEFDIEKLDLEVLDKINGGNLSTEEKVDIYEKKVAQLQAKLARLGEEDSKEKKEVQEQLAVFTALFKRLCQ